METASSFTSDQTARDQAHVIEKLRSANRELARALEENSRLQTDKLYLASIVESSSYAIIGVDLKGAVTAWNEAAERMFGYRADEILGRPVALLSPADRLEREAQLISRVAGGESLTAIAPSACARTAPSSTSRSPCRPSATRAGPSSALRGSWKTSPRRSCANVKCAAWKRTAIILPIWSNRPMTPLSRAPWTGGSRVWNKAAEAMFGYSAGEVVGLPLACFRRPSAKMKPRIFSGG